MARHISIDEARRAHAEAEAELAAAIKAGASEDEIYELDAATTATELALREAGED